MTTPTSSPSLQEAWTTYCKKHAHLDLLVPPRTEPAELQRQYQSLEGKIHAIKQEFATKRQVQQQERSASLNDLSQRLQAVQTAKNDLTFIYHWDCLLEELEQLVEESEQEALPNVSEYNSLLAEDDTTIRASSAAAAKSTTTTGSKPMMPSAEALCLIHYNNNNNNNNAPPVIREDKNSDDKDLMLRATRMDHALLTAKVELLHKQLHYAQHVDGNLASVAKILTECQVWRFLAPASAMSGQN